MRLGPMIGIAGARAPAAHDEETASLEEIIAHAHAALQADNPNFAAAIAHSVLQKAPDFFPALHLFGMLAYRAGDNAQATDAMDRAAKSEPRDPRFHRNHALVLSAAGRWDDAILACRRAL